MLVVAGDEALRALATAAARDRGWAPHACATGTDAIFRVTSEPPDVLVYAEPLPDMPVSQLWHALDSTLRHVIRVRAAVWSGDGRTLDQPVGWPSHIRLVEVPPRADALTDALAALEGLVPPRAVETLASRLDGDDDASWHGMVGGTPIMRDLFGLMRRLAPHVRTALIVGEPGTGKELVARVLHRAGPRAERQFVALDCASLGDVAPDTFGLPWRAAGELPAWGVLQQAAGGVLFLDAVGELTATAQGRLLTALEARGMSDRASLAGHAPDVHVFAASDRDLRPDVAAGRFRRDLFYYLSVVELRVPALRERRPDITRLASVFLRSCGRNFPHALEGFTEDAEALLVNAPWEGNVRELRSLIERVALLSEGPQVTAREVLACLPGEWQVTADAESANRDAHERARFLAVLDEVGGNKKAAAARLGLSRRAFYRRLERLSMDATIARRPVRRLAS